MGAVAAELFASEGARVAVVDVSEGGAAVAERISDNGGEATFLHADIADSTAVQEVVNRVAATYGRLDVLYNNAGIRPADDRPADELPEEVWDRVMGVNIRGMYLCCRYGLKLMLAEKEELADASIVNAASMAGVVANAAIPSPTAYTTSKGAVMGLTKQLSITYARKRIRCNAICAGAIETAILQKILAEDPTARGRFDESVPMGRIGQPEDVAQLALFLASEESSYITGQYIVIDGGYTSV
jgi:NAD(P)-dependent dehydrogenase (short-subunit alcohol dehydrogenase family)